MKKIRVIVFSTLLLLSPSGSFSKTLTIDDLMVRDDAFYEKFKDVPFNGTVSGIQNGELRYGQREGLWTFYYPNGQLEKKGVYNYGEKEGIWLNYWHNGQLFRKGEYKGGVKEGFWTDFHENGQLWDVGFYKSGLKENSWKTYWINGQLYSEGKYLKGALEGSWSYYKIDGKKDMIFSGFYRNGYKQ